MLKYKKKTKNDINKVIHQLFFFQVEESPQEAEDVTEVLSNVN